MTVEFCKHTENRALNPKVLFCNATISNLDFIPSSLYLNKNMFVTSNNQIVCNKSILDKKYVLTYITRIKYKYVNKLTSLKKIMVSTI